MKKKNSDKESLDEYYGTQRSQFAGGPGPGSNFYHGNDLGTHTRGSLGTRGADSNFSRRTQALVPADYYDLLEEEEDENEENMEEYVVENSKYSLLKAHELNENALTKILSDLAGDTAAALGASIPGIGVGLSVGLVGWNASQLDDDMEDADIAINAFRTRPNDDTVEEMEEVFDSLGTNLIDLMQRTLEVLPDAETPSWEIASFATSLGVNASRLAAIAPKFVSTGNFLLKNLKKLGEVFRTALSKTGLVSKFRSADAARRAGEATSKASAVWSKVKVHGVVMPVMKWFVEILDSDIAPKALSDEKSLILAVPNKMILLGDLIEDYYVQKEAASMAGVPFVYEDRVLGRGVDPNSYDPDRSISRLDPTQRPGLEYSESNLEADFEDDDRISSDQKDFLRKMFLTRKDGSDSGLFFESLEKRNLAYILETFEEEKEDEEELIVGDEEEKSEIDEFSGAGAIGGVAGKMGHEADGSRTTQEKLRKRYDYFNKTYGMK